MGEPDGTYRQPEEESQSSAEEDAEFKAEEKKWQAVLKRQRTTKG